MSTIYVQLQFNEYEFQFVILNPLRKSLQKKSTMNTGRLLVYLETRQPHRISHVLDLVYCVHTVA